MYTPEVAEVSVPIELLGDNRKSGSLREIEPRWGGEIAGRDKVGHA